MNGNTRIFVLLGFLTYFLTSSAFLTSEKMKPTRRKGAGNVKIINLVNVLPTQGSLPYLSTIRKALKVKMRYRTKQLFGIWGPWSKWVDRGTIPPDDSSEWNWPDAEIELALTHEDRKPTHIRFFVKPNLFYLVNVTPEAVGKESRVVVNTQEYLEVKQREEGAK